MSKPSDFLDDETTTPAGPTVGARFRRGIDDPLPGDEPSGGGPELAITVSALGSAPEVVLPAPLGELPRARSSSTEPTPRGDDDATSPRARVASLGHEPTALGGAAHDRTWTFNVGATVDADDVVRPGSSALDALLADIERSFAGAKDSAQPGPLIGHANRFQLTARLGHGGMGVVFRAFDQELRRFIAIKLLAPAQLLLGEGGMDRFLRHEARAIAALSHPNIVQVFDISSWCEVPFLVMEYLQGRSLDELWAEPAPVARVLSIADQLLAGLEHAHERGVIHRDLKPSNVFETERGEIKILDFGIASPSGAASPHGADISGTPGYMAPEQWLGAPQDARTDVWGAGMLLLGMLTGRPLYAERSAVEVRREVLGERPTLLERDYRIPRPLFRVLEKALEKDPVNRYQTAAQLRAALSDVALALGHTTRARAPQSAEQRQLTLVATSLSIDAVGDFETAAGLLRTWQNTVGAIVQRAGGFVLSSAGAVIVACFGYPVAREDDAVRAVGVACAIRDGAAELVRPSERTAQVRIGVDTGVGVVEEAPAAVGGGPVLQGAAVHGAQRLRERAAPGQLLVGAATAELVRGYFTATQYASTGEAAFLIGSARPLASRFDASLSEVAPLVGRDDELEAQDRLWREVIDGRGAVYCLVGDAGVGKSRLVHRLRQRVVAEGGVALVCQCWPQTAQSPFQSVLALLRQALELDGAGAESGAGRAQLELGRLERGLARLGLDDPRDTTVLATALALPLPAGAPPAAESAEALRRAIIDRSTALLERLAARAPLALVFEDLHWADHSTLDFLDFLLPRVAGHRLLVALTARREVEPFWRQRARCHERDLAGLPPEVAAALVRHLHERLAGGVALPAELCGDIVARSSGLPLYLEELTRACAQRGAEGSSAGSPPASLLGLLGARLDQVSPAARAAAQLGAVLGRDFRDELLEVLVAEAPLTGDAHDRSGAVAAPGARAHRVSTVGGLGAVELDSALDELCAKGIVQRAVGGEGPSYVFRHALMQDVAYQTMPPELLRARHAQVAELLARWSDAPESRPAEVAAASPELVAYHYDRAGRAEPALAFWEKAGHAAAKKWAVKEASQHLGRALQLLTTTPESVARDEHELRLLLALGPPLMSVHGYAAPRVEDTYARAYELCVRRGRHAQTFPPLVGLWQYNMVGGNLGKAAVLGARLLTLAQGVGDSTMKLIAKRAIGTTRFLQGDLLEAIEHTRAGWQLYDRAEHGELAFRHGNDPGVGHGIYLAWALWHVGEPDQALAQAEATLGLARSLAHPMSVAFSLCYTAIIRNLRGEHAEAQVLLSEAITVAEDNQLGLWKALALIQLGWARAASGEREGVATMVQGIAAWRQTGARAGTTFFFVALAQAQLRHGEREAARESLASAVALVEQNGEHFYEPELLRTRASTLDPATHGEEIAALHARALEQARTQGARSWALRVWSSRLELALAARAADGAELARARDGVRDCLTSFSEGHATADLRRAMKLLARAAAEAT